MSSETAAGLSRGAWVSLGIFGLLLVLVFATREDRVEAGVRRLDLPRLSASEVVGITVRGKDIDAALRKEGGSWRVAAGSDLDRDFAADEGLVKSALDALAELEADAFVTGRAEKHEDLEIDAEKGLVVGIDAGTRKLDLVFGRVAKGGGNYLRLADTDEVFVGKGRFASLVRKDLKGWRKRKLLDIELDQVREIEVAVPSAKNLMLTSEKEGDTGKRTWSFGPGVAVPEGFRVDQDALARVATSLVGLRASDFADEVSEEQTGFQTGARVQATLTDGKKISVQFGNEDDKKRVYAKVDGDPQVYLVASYSVKSLLKEPEDFRDLTLLPFDAEKVEAVALTTRQERVEIKKENGSFVLVAPETTPPGYEFDAAGVSGKLAGIAKMRGSAFLPTPPARNGLEQPQLTIEVTLEGGETRQLVFGNEAPKEQDGGSTFYARGDGNLVYRVPSYQKSRFDKPLDYFKKVAPPPMPPGGMGGMGGMGGGLDSLPPEIRKQLEAAMKNQGR